MRLFGFLLFIIGIYLGGLLFWIGLIVLLIILWHWRRNRPVEAYHDFPHMKYMKYTRSFSPPGRMQSQVRLTSRPTTIELPRRSVVRLPGAVPRLPRR